MIESNKKQRIVELVREKGMLRPTDIAADGLPREYLSRMVKSGELVRAQHGLYHLPDYEPNEHQSLVEVRHRIRRGVICLLSALSVHNLTTQNPFQVWVAVENKSYVPSIDYPPVRVVYFSGDAFKSGIDMLNTGGTRIPVFNEAKTVVDCFKYRNKVGMDVAMEALRDGWRQKRFTMDEIHKYAEICRMKNVMQPYLEMLVSD